MAWRHYCDIIIWYLMSIMSKNIDICPLFTCKVSRRDIYYIKNYAEIIKICDILMTDFRAVWPRRAYFSDLHDIYRFMAVSLFRFTWYLQDLSRIPFSIYMIFTGYWHSPFFDLHDIYRILGVSFFLFTCSLLVSHFEFTGYFLTFTCFS